MAVAQNKIGNKAALWGAIGGTIPDLDVFLRFFLNPVQRDFAHRGFSHSIVFALLAALILSFLLNKWKPNTYEFKNTFWLFLVAIGTHPVLDSFTKWGTQLFWPFEIRLDFNGVFVIDPIYTLPFLVLLSIALIKKNKIVKQRLIIWGISFSSLYLLWGWSVHQWMKTKYKSDYVAPMPFTTFHWMTIDETDSTFIMKERSIFSSSVFYTATYSKNKALEKAFFGSETNADFEVVKKFTHNLFVLSGNKDSLFVHDLRFGNLSIMTDYKSNTLLRGYLFFKDQNGMVSMEDLEMSFTDEVSLSQYFSNLLK